MALEAEDPFAWDLLSRNLIAEFCCHVYAVFIQGTDDFIGCIFTDCLLSHFCLCTFKRRISHAGNDSNLLIVFYVQIMPD
ncbi:hypothetical protein, partial [Mixta calida]|uniref:hypothetical protein n=1 Tax=Mixta calida TaxID=665913 RepID=UPI0035E3E2AF